MAKTLESETLQGLQELPTQKVISSAMTSYSVFKVEELSCIDDIKRAYQQLFAEEERVSKELELVLSQHTSIQKNIDGLQIIIPDLQTVYEDSEQLSNMIEFTSTLAENVSHKVRELDVAKSRVIMAMQRVDDILDLKHCTDGVKVALDEEVYEQAAMHIHRFLTLDESVLKISADGEEGTLDASFELLNDSKHRLIEIVHKKFDHAVETSDVASIERFFKIFPLIGQHEDGLSKFSQYLCTQLSATATKNLDVALKMSKDEKRANVLYADTLTLLFEGIARIVETHQPIVETYYGHGRLFTMIQCLQRECDRHARKIIGHFKQEREFDTKTQLVSQGINFKKGSHNKLFIEPKDLDVLLAEITLLNTRSEMYLRFIKRRVVGDVEVAVQANERKSERLADLDSFLKRCELSMAMQELIGSYITMEEYFMKEMVIKAVSMDSSEDDGNISSMVDDTFYIVKKCIKRAMSSSSLDGVCAMLNHASTLLEHDFKCVLHSRLSQGFPSGFDLSSAYNLMQSTFQQGRLQAADSETLKAKQAFLVTMNNIEVSCEHIQTLKNNLEGDILKLYSEASEQGLAKLNSCLSDFGMISCKFKESLDFGFNQIVQTVIKTRIKPWTDSFNSVSRTISEEEFSNYEANDPWVQNFIVNVDSLLGSFKTWLTSSNYDTLVSHLTNEITTQLERVVLKSPCNRLGGLQFDKELRSLIAYLTSATTWTLRDRFARLSQMSTILNLERVSEILDYWGTNSGPLTWRLTPTDVRQVLTLRVDFKNEDIKKLKL